MRVIRAVIGPCMLALGASVVSAQNYPNKPIRIVTTEPGGGNDFAARLIAPGLSSNLGQPVIVDNRGGGVIPAEIVSRASPDGYTVMVHGGTFHTWPLLQKTSYDPIRDFLTVSLLARSPNILVVHPSSPAKSVKELIALAKAKPGELNYGAGNLGSPNHLSSELFKAMAGIDIVRVPFKGAGPAVAGLISNQVQLMFASAGSAMTHVKSGRLRALAVTSAEPSALAPGLPTVAASGLPGFESIGPTGMFAPAGTPPAIIRRLNQEVVRFIRTPEATEQFLNSGVEAVGSSPEQFAALIKAETTTLGKLIKDVGIRAP